MKEADKQEEMNEVFVKTENATRMMQFCNTIIKRNQWGSITGAPGIGKTEIKKELLRFLGSFPERYIVINTVAFASMQNRTGAIIKEMVRSIDRGIPVPGNIESKVRVLRNALVQTIKDGRQVVMIIDESQKYSYSQLTEIKMLHEMEGMGKTNMFSIIMFNKTDNKFDDALESREIGKRVQQRKMELPSEVESYKIAEEKFNLQFKDSGAKTDFLKATGRYPVAIKYLAQLLWGLAGFDGKITKDMLKRSRIEERNRALAEANISRRDLQKYLKMNGMEVSLGMINETLNEQRQGKIPDQILDLTNRAIKEAKEQAA